MPLKYPKSLSYNDFNGGYNSKGTSRSINDNETISAKNVEVLPNGTIAKRRGFRKLLNTALSNYSTGGGGLKIDTSGTGTTIVGHFQMIKQADPVDTKTTIVAAGGNLWQYNSQTASVIATGFNTANQWYFAQIQDPRSAVDDIAVMVNGIDEPQIWNASEPSAANLSDQISAAGVVPAKFIESLKNKLYLLNVKDDADVDSKSKIIISSFSDEGSPRPQRFIDFFYVGGSDKEGEITGSTVLNDQLIIFKRNATFKFAPGASIFLDTAQLVQIDNEIGCIAPGTIAVFGNSVMFLGELGVFSFDGNRFTYVSNNIEKDLVNVNKRFISQAKGIFYRSKNQYWLTVPDQGSEYLNKTLIYDLTKNIWYPPYDGFDLSVLSTQNDLRNVQRVIRGDRFGFLYYHNNGFADNVTGTFEGYVTSIEQSGSLLVSDLSNLPTDGDGIGPAKVRIVSGAGLGNEYTAIKTEIHDAGLLVGTIFNSSITPSYVHPSLTIEQCSNGTIDAASFDSGILSLNTATDLEAISYHLTPTTGFSGDCGTVRIEVRSNVGASLSNFLVFEIGVNTASNSLISLSHSGTNGWVGRMTTTAGLAVTFATTGNAFGPTISTASFTMVDLSWTPGDFYLSVNGTSTINAAFSTGSYDFRPVLRIGRNMVGDANIADFDVKSIAYYNYRLYTYGHSDAAFTTQTNINSFVLASDEDGTGLDSTSKFVIGGIDSYYRTPDFDFGHPDGDKMHRRVIARVVQEGEHELKINYFVNFKPINLVPTSTISLISDGTEWGSATYDNATFGNTEIITRKVVIKSINTQSLTGRNFSIRFANDRPFQPWEVQGYDIQAREIGRR